MSPTPASPVSRVGALESANYLRNQLLRDADWAGMAHGVEIRVPLVDAALLTALAPSIPALKPGVGKAALARSPSVPLLDEITARAKTGFGVPTADWMKAASGEVASAADRAPSAAGLVSRRWSRVVFAAPLNGPLNGRLEARAA
jgi:asparagine synthase (glutamine-hydrolysing)